MLQPGGPDARAIAMIWNVMAWGSALILIGILALGAAACRRTPRPGERSRAGVFLLGGGLAFPGVVLLALLIYGLRTGDARIAFPDEQGAWRVDVHARQWQWEVRYPDAPHPGWTTQNEIIAPAGRPLHISVTSHDVIHSLWIPQLGGKIDAIPGRINVIRLMADEPGRYRGVCAEFCGVGHSRMPILLHAHDPATFAKLTQEVGHE